MKKLIVNLLGFFAGWLIPANPALVYGLLSGGARFAANAFGRNNYQNDPMYQKFGQLSDQMLAFADRPQDSPSFLAPLSQIREAQREANRNAAGIKASGGTQEGQIAYMDKTNRNAQMSIAQLMGQLDNIGSRYFGQGMQALGAQQGIKNQADQVRMGSANNIGSNLSNMFGNLLAGSTYGAPSSYQGIQMPQLGGVKPLSLSGGSFRNN